MKHHPRLLQGFLTVRHHTGDDDTPLREAVIRLNSSIDRKQSAVQTSSYVTLLVAVVSELLGVDFHLLLTCLSLSRYVCVSVLNLR